MSGCSKRPEVTIETMGRVRNPTGEGVKATSSGLKKKIAIVNSTSTTLEADTKRNEKNDADHDTKVKEAGSSRRNITRKNTKENSQLYDNKKKKQGGSGKGKWGGPLDDSDMVEAKVGPLDENDPLYDQTEEGNIILSSSNGIKYTRKDSIGYDPVAEGVVYGPLLTLAEFKLRLGDAVKEYFDSADSDEVISSIEEMKCKEYHPEVVKRAISLSLDEGPRERELVSRLLTCLHPRPLKDIDVEKGFEILLDSLDDLCIDIPDAKEMVGCFLARAIVDEVIPPAFISNRNNSHPGDGVVERAVSLLSREHCTARLEKVWGPGDGRPVSELKEVIDQLIEEYLLSMELDEAARCVREMNAPHFHHELVKRGVKISMEKDGLDHSDSPSSSLDAIAALFSFLVKNAIVSEHQVAKGVSRLHKILPDLVLDVPAAPAMLDEFEKMAIEGGCMTPSSE
jgi:programmed cell death protein 4